MNTNSYVRAARGTVGVLLVGLAWRADAQDRPAVFVHGFKSTGSVWANTAQTMTSRLQLTALTPSTPWYATFDT